MKILRTKYRAPSPQKELNAAFKRMARATDIAVISLEMWRAWGNLAANAHEEHQKAKLGLRQALEKSFENL